MSRAWDLLRRIFVERPEIRGEFSPDVVNWVTDDSREAARSGATMKIGLVEKEVLEFKNRLEIDSKKGVFGEGPEPTSGWRTWRGEWTPRPIGVL
jgi:hypothetical protein